MLCTRLSSLRDKNNKNTIRSDYLVKKLMYPPFHLFRDTPLSAVGRYCVVLFSGRVCWRNRNRKPL